MKPSLFILSIYPYNLLALFIFFMDEIFSNTIL